MHHWLQQFEAAPARAAAAVTAATGAATEGAAAVWQTSKVELRAKQSALVAVMKEPLPEAVCVPMH